MSAYWGVCGSRFPRFWLQRRWASRQFFRSNGDPPLDTGMISSTSGLPGWPWVSVLSTGCLQSQQCVSSRSTRALILSRRVPLERLGFGLDAK